MGVWLGCYISKCVYYRAGEKSLDCYYRPYHRVEYFRYVRFFPEGKINHTLSLVFLSNQCFYVFCLSTLLLQIVCVSTRGIFIYDSRNEVFVVHYYAMYRMFVISLQVSENLPVVKMLYFWLTQKTNGDWVRDML